MAVIFEDLTKGCPVCGGVGGCYNECMCKMCRKARLYEERDADATSVFILCRPLAVRDGAVYDHNVERYRNRNVVVVRCHNRFLAEYQLGRLRSMFGWSVNKEIYPTKQDAIDAADTLQHQI